jgi:hypothetical protein
VLFDGSASRGEGLTYYLEFGDGQSVTTASATHPMQREGSYTARLTVVDRFGRSDSETTSFWAQSLVDNLTFGFYWSSGGSLATCQCPNALLFLAQDGTRVTGSHYYNGFRGEVSSFTGAVTADGDVRLKFDRADVTLTGTLFLGDGGASARRLTLTFEGGPHHGERVDFRYRTGD